MVITFNVHKDGSITDLSIVGPLSNRCLQQRRVRRSLGSNPTQPLPPEYPSDKAFFTVTFFYKRSAAAVTRSQRLGLLVLFSVFVVYVAVRLTL